MKLLFRIAFCYLCFSVSLHAQENSDVQVVDQDSLTLIIQKEIGAYQAIIDSLQALIAIPAPVADSTKIWDFSFNGIFGLDFNQFKNWVGRGEDYNSVATSISGAITTEANMLRDNFFWRNSGRLALGWQKFENRGDNTGFQKTVDLLNVNTHLGSKLNEHFAFSILGAWRSQVLDQAITPSYLDSSIGLTWTPKTYFLAVLHPANYELILSDQAEYESSFGAKVVLNYDQQISRKLHLKSNLTGSLSYENIEGLTNYTWTNGVNVKVVDGIGLGVEYAYRVSPQETNALNIEDTGQSYLIMGISYVLP